MDTKILFCDIDGTLTETISGHDFKQHPKDVKVIEGANNSVAHFASKGYHVLGVSNQAGIASGYKSLSDTVEEMQFTLSLFPGLSLIYFCPDYDGEILWSVSLSNGEEIIAKEFPSFRKPGTGMIDYVFRHQGNPDPKNSLFVGDRKEDQECAFEAGINFMWAEFWRSRNY